MTNLEKKLDRLISLLEEQELVNYHQQCKQHSGKNLFREVILNTILASVVGYFMFRILDAHFRKAS